MRDLPETTLGADFARIMPGEIVLPERLLQRPALFEVFADWKGALTPEHIQEIAGALNMDPKTALAHLAEHLPMLAGKA